MIKKVLILYIGAGHGHKVAAYAVKSAFNAKHPEVVVDIVDIVDCSGPIYKKIFVDGYNLISAKGPSVWGMLYKLHDKQSRHQLFQLISKLALESRLLPLIKKSNPDLIIGTYFLPTRLISFSKQQNIINIPSAVVIPDYGCHSFYVDPEVNYYFVATDYVAQCLQDYGVPASKITVSGIPIDLKFAVAPDVAQLRKKLTLADHKKTILIVGGQFSFLTLNKIVAGINAANQSKVQFLIVAGHDKKLAKAIAQSDLGKNENVKTFELVDNMEELMSVSDLIFSKAGGLTVSECLAKGLPMVINKVIPGQEEDNVTYLVNQGAAVKAKTFSGIVMLVNDLIDHPEKIEQMKRKAQALGRPQAASAVVDYLVNKVK